VGAASAPRRAVPLLGAALAAVLIVAGCGGGSGDQTVSLGDGATVTVPSDVHDVYGEVEAFLDQLPYQRWYTHCVVAQVERSLSPKEAKELATLPESRRETEAMKLIGNAGSTCEKAHDRPVVDPNASRQELALYRAGTLPGMAEFAQANGYSPSQTACVESFYKKLSDRKLIELANGTDKVREGILVSVFRPCAMLK